MLLRFWFAPAAWIVAVFGCAPSAAPLAESERGVAAGEVLQLHTLQGRTVRVVAGDSPGESDLFVDDVALAPHGGPDDQPLILQGNFSNQVAFVSGRSGVASVWRVDVVTGALVQLTNRNQQPGHLDLDFVSPPVRSLRQDGDDLVYDDGNGQEVRVSLRPRVLDPR